MSADTCPCRLCGKPTQMTGTGLCDNCWELNRRVQRDPDIALRILAEMGLMRPPPSTASLVNELTARLKERL